MKITGKHILTEHRRKSTEKSAEFRRFRKILPTSKFRIAQFSLYLIYSHASYCRLCGFASYSGALFSLEIVSRPSVHSGTRHPRLGLNQNSNRDCASHPPAPLTHGTLTVFLQRQPGWQVFPARANRTLIEDRKRRRNCRLTPVLCKIRDGRWSSRIDARSGVQSNLSRRHSPWPPGSRRFLYRGTLRHCTGQ